MIGSLLAGQYSSGQVLRLGPFDVSAQTGLQLVYSTNVEGERPSEAVLDREDYFLVWSISLASSAQIVPRTQLTLIAGYSHEWHYVRDDLDTDLGRIGGVFVTDLNPLTLRGGAGWQRDTEMDDTLFVPQGVPRQRRKVGTTADAFAGADWAMKYLGLGINYNVTQERYEDEAYRLGENDENTLTYYGQLNLPRSVYVRYEMEDTETDFINIPEVTEDSTETITINTDQLFNLLERPKVTLSIGVQQETVDGESDGWEFIYTVTASDEFDISPTLNLKVFASYNYEQNPEDDEVAFQYGAMLTHLLSSRTTHSLSARRQPVETFGSTDDTDETEYRYAISIRDIVIPALVLSASVGYTISDPLAGETEKVWDWAAGLSHSAQISSRITRTLSYVFTREDSNLETELLDEHRVTLTFTYQF
jgi:hypothetical protein